MKHESEQKPSKGTQAAAEVREKTNSLSDEQRHHLMGRAMELIYRGGLPQHVSADRR